MVIGNMVIRTNDANEYVVWMIGINSINSPSDRYFSGSNPIKRYRTEGSKITPQVAMYAVSSRFMPDEISMVSMAQANRASQRNRCSPARNTPMLHRTGKLSSMERLCTGAEKVVVSHTPRNA